jgi:sec-independent protein translocase protein TatC
MRRADRRQELRDRITESAVVFGAAFVVGIFLARFVLTLVASRVETICGSFFHISDPTDVLALYIKVALLFPLGIAMPIFAQQVAGFIAPEQAREERRILLSSLPASSLLFVAGALFALFLAAPIAFRLLSSADGGIFDWQVGCWATHRLILAMMLGFGLAFQLPLNMSVLARLGLVSPERLRTGRKYAILAILVLSAIFRPAPAAISLIVVAIPLYAAYELGPLLAARVAYSRAATTPA